MLYLALLCLTIFLLYYHFKLVLFTTGSLSLIVISVNCFWFVIDELKRLLLTFSGHGVNPRKKAVLVTGSDDGFGWSTAKLLNKKGYRVLACCLFPEGDGAKTLLQEADYPDRMEIIPLDITNQSQVDTTVQLVTKILQTNGEQLWSIVNIAAIYRVAFIESGTFEENFQEVMDINTLGHIRMTRAFLPLIRQSKGRVIFLSSLAAKWPTKFVSAYAISKASIQSFAESLAWEVKQFGVKVITIQQCFAQIPLVNCERITKEANEIYKHTPEEVRQAYGRSLFIKLEKLCKIATGTFFVPDYVSTKTPETIVSAMEDPNPWFIYQIAPIHLRSALILTYLHTRDLCLYVTRFVWDLV